jgi:hypothetical protein
MIAWLAVVRGLPWKLIVKIAGIAAVVGLLLWYRHSLIEQGRAEVRAEWRAADVVANATAETAIREREREDAADAARNIEVEKDYAKKLSAAAADRSRLERQLRNAIAAASGGGGAGQGSDKPRTPEASSPGGPEPPDPTAGLAGDIAAALTEARENASQLDALIAEITPQL